MIIITPEEKEKKIKIAYLIILCKFEAMKKDKTPLSGIRYASEIAMWLYEVVRISRIRAFESGGISTIN